MDTVMIFWQCLKLRSSLLCQLASSSCHRIVSTPRRYIFLIFLLVRGSLDCKSTVLNLARWVRVVRPPLISYEGVDVDWSMRICIGITLSSIHDVTELWLLIRNHASYSADSVAGTCHVWHLDLPTNSRRSDSTSWPTVWLRPLCSFTTDVSWVWTTNWRCKGLKAIILTGCCAWNLYLFQLRIFGRLGSHSFIQASAVVAKPSALALIWRNILLQGALWFVFGIRLSLLLHFNLYLVKINYKQN